MPSFTRSILSQLAVLACAACGGDYWLGGAQGTGPTASDDLHELTEDVVLSGDQNYEAGSANRSGCRIVGHGHSIRSKGTWTGHVSIRGCELTGLGSAETEAISLTTHGAGYTTIEDSRFDASGTIHVASYDATTVSFRNNVILPSSSVTLDPSFDATIPVFRADGDSEAPKLFQGNRIYRSTSWFRSPAWLIGGDSDRESNILIGLRVGFALDASRLVLRGNYVHNLPFPDSGDESTLTVLYSANDVLAEHNVLRHGTWVIRGFGGELRYNAILDADNAAWLEQPFENSKVHHNLFFMCEPPRGSDGVYAGIELVNARAKGIELFNNTLDGGGPAMQMWNSAVSVVDGCFLDSLRSNAIFGFPLERNDHGEASIRPGITERIDPPAKRLGYADYNLFFNPDAGAPRNYALAVANHTLRTDAGFALHDARSGGPVDQQLEPGLAASNADCFPFSDDDIKSGSVTVSRMLAAWRAVYTPRAGSPLIGAGDPADARNNPIGAIGDGTQANDRFGMFGR